MSGISLQFGPEWMRSKHVSTPSSMTRTSQSMLSPSTTQTPTSSLYSPFVTNTASGQEREGSGTSFKYSKEEMLQVWTEGGGRGPLGVEIELWEGIVKELGGDPIGLKELSELETKVRALLFASSLNSELRRRQSHDVLPNSLERPKLNSSASNAQTSFGQSRFSPLLTRKRKEESTDPAISALRRLSLSSPLSPAGGPMSPTGSLASPRAKWGPNSPALENVIVEENWRKKDEKKEDMLSDIPPPVNHNTPGEGQAVDFTSHHIIAPTAFGADIIDKNGVERDVTTREEVQAAVQALPVHGPSLGGVLNGHIGVPKLDEYLVSVPKTNDGFSLTHPPGFELDPATVTWVYRDPKGNIQGPFPASLMQKWYDEGYFAPDLLVKRSQLDTWIMVGELAMHARSGQLFLQLYPEYLPPGLFSKSSLLHDTQRFDHFRHPSTPSDNQVGDHSRHPATFQDHNAANYAGILDSYSNISPVSIPIPPNPGILPIPLSPEAVFQQAVPDKAAMLQPVVSRLANFEHTVAHRDDNIGYSRVDSIPRDQLQSFSVSHGVQSDSGMVHNDTATAISFSQTLFGSSDTHSPHNVPSSFSPSSLSNREQKTSLNGLGVSQPLPTGDDLHQNVGFTLETPTFSRQKADKQPAFKEELALTSPDQYSYQTSQLYSSSENVTSTIVIFPPATREVASADMIPVQNAESTELLPGADVPKPNRTQQEVALNDEIGNSVAGMAKENISQNDRPDVTHDIPENVKKGDLETAFIAPMSSTMSGSTSASFKPAWKHSLSSADDVKPGLREIQEVEARKSEARKLAERQKEWNTRPANAFTDETPGLPTTWGLSISQVGNSKLASKEPFQHQPSPSSIHPPVWTNASKPNRINQTMKEIQEEELKKKTLDKEKETAQSVNRRAYAESANKSNLPGGGAWTTVGASGRHNRVLAPSIVTTHPAAIRQTPIATATTTSQPTVFMKPVTNAATRPQSNALLPSAKAPSRSNSSSADDSPVPPSPEFIKWLRGALRGFNTGFNTEEFMTMLLAFSLDFPPSTIEVIQDMVYMNSDTMDGRRFAAEFCSKRKDDAANRPKNTDGRQPSLADVVKTQPKPLQSDLPFKVVKKKGKK